MDDSQSDWVAVRSVLGTPLQPDGTRAYEERITLWRERTLDEAMRRAREEANAYAALWDPPADVLSLQHAVTVYEEPGDGTEIFALVRDSDLAPEEYLNRFFDSGSERLVSDSSSE